jgi:polyhydroxybutyrate depolymerase
MNHLTRAARAIIPVLVVSASLTGLAGSADPAGATSTPTSSPGCGSGGVTSAILTLPVGGFSRTVIVHVPHGTSGKKPLALVLNLHGSGATAADQDIFSGMDVTADDDDFIVAYPQGLIPYLTGYDWNVPGVPLVSGASVPKGAASDVKFLTSLVGLLEAKYCVDPREVYATGFSGGAREVSQLACDSSNVFAAIAPVSGLRRPTPCPTKRAVPVIAFHGSADPVDPFDGHGLAYWTYSVPTAAKDWGSQDHCSFKVKVTHPDADVTLTTYGHCADGAAVELYEITGEGHEWPGGPTMPTSLTSTLGPQSSAVSANQLMWEFFAAHPLP